MCHYAWSCTYKRSLEAGSWSVLCSVGYFGDIIWESRLSWMLVLKISPALLYEFLMCKFADIPEDDRHEETGIVENKNK